MLLPQCKKVFACKVKMKNLFSLQLQQNFLVQQCFLPLFFLFVVGFYSNRLTTVAVVQLLVQTSFRTGVFGGFPLHIAFYDKKDIFRQNLPLTCAWRDVQYSVKPLVLPNHSHFARSISFLAARSRFSSDCGNVIFIASMSSNTNFGLLFLKITTQPQSSQRRTTLEKFWFASVMETI